MPKLTRIRVEGTALPSEGRTVLEGFLTDEAFKVRDLHGGDWQPEDTPQLQLSTRGWWGQYTLRRKA